MAKHILDDKQTAPWIIKGKNGDWIVTKDGEINVSANGSNESVIGIYEDDIISGNDIIVNGDISAIGPSTGIYSEGKNTDIRIGATGEIDAGMGVLAKGSGARVFNHGEIDAVSVGVYSETATRIVNSGEILGNTGIVAFHDGAAILNQTGGAISGINGIVTDVNDATITNFGTILGLQYALEGGDGETLLVNHGRIFGDIRLGGGDDEFVNKAGNVFGSIGGGKGDDLYRVNRASLFVKEDVNEGVDTVLASVSYNLTSDAGEVDIIRAVGSANINLTGNSYANALVGNAGKNTLSGDGGADHLQGRAGNDVLAGGADGDIFDFALGCGKDVINDFTQGEDLIQLDAYGDLEFADIAGRTTDISAGTKITLDNGDSILLKDVHNITFTVDDFLI